MAFDGITVACMAHELNKNLAGGSRKQQTEISCLGFDRQKKFVGLWLRDL